MDLFSLFRNFEQFSQSFAFKKSEQCPHIENVLHSTFDLCFPMVTNYTLAVSCIHPSFSSIVINVRSNSQSVLLLRK